MGRELISADLDGELADDERELLDRHIASCAGCASFAEDAAAIHRASRVAAAVDVPDLTDRILERAAADPELAGAVATPPADARGRWRSRRRAGAPARIGGAAVVALQYLLLVVSLTMVVLAVPELLATTGGAVHTAHHLGAWDLAFAVGLVVAALQPWRARGLLPMAAALGGVMVLTAGLDIARGMTTSVAEFSHLLEVFGLVVLWLLARATPRAEPGGHRRRVPADGAGGASPRLRVLHQLRSIGPSPRPGRAPAPVASQSGSRPARDPLVHGERAA